MKWQDIAESVADIGLPILATAFGIPGPVADFAARMVKKALGLPASATPADVQSTITQMDPDTARAALESAQSEVQAKYAYLTRIVEIQGQNATEVNKTMQAELGKVSWWHWRHQIGNVVAFEILVFPMAALATIIFGDAEKTKAMIEYSGQLTIILGIASGLLGVVAVNNTTRAATAVTGEMPESIASKVVKTVLPKKRA